MLVIEFVCSARMREEFGYAFSVQLQEFEFSSE